MDVTIKFVRLRVSGVISWHRIAHLLQLAGEWREAVHVFILTMGHGFLSAFISRRGSICSWRESWTATWKLKEWHQTCGTDLYQPCWWQHFAEMSFSALVYSISLFQIQTCITGPSVHTAVPNRSTAYREKMQTEQRKAWTRIQTWTFFHSPFSSKTQSIHITTTLWVIQVSWAAFTTFNCFCFNPLFVFIPVIKLNRSGTSVWTVAFPKRPTREKNIDVTQQLLLLSNESRRYHKTWRKLIKLKHNKQHQLFAEYWWKFL